MHLLSWYAAPVSVKLHIFCLCLHRMSLPNNSKSHLCFKQGFSKMMHLLFLPEALIFVRKQFIAIKMKMVNILSRHQYPLFLLHALSLSKNNQYQIRSNEYIFPSVMQHPLNWSSSLKQAIECP